jgi:hypothetical protein
MKNESKSIIKREEREENLKKIDKSIVSAINDIKNIENQSLTVKIFKVLTKFLHKREKKNIHLEATHVKND